MTALAAPATHAKEPGADARHPTLLTVGGITAVAVVLRLIAMRGSFFGDELFTHEIATRNGLGAVLDGVRSELEITPPLFFIVAWVFQKLGDPLVWLRVPSLLAGIATVPLVYVLGIRTVGRRAALIGTAFFAVSPMATYYSTEARAYSLMMLLVVLSTLALLRATETNQTRWWIAVALLVAAAMYTHYTAVFVLVAQAGWALVAHRAQWLRILAAQVAALVLYLPWIPSFLDDRHAPAEKAIGLLHPFPATAFDDLKRFVDGGPYAPLSKVPGVPALVLLGLAAVIVVGGLLWRLFRVRPVVDARVVLIAVLAFATPVGAAVFSAVGDNVFVPRNLLASLPALSLALAAALLALPNLLFRVALALTIVALGLGAVSTLGRDAQRPAYAEVGAYVNAHIRPGDQVLELTSLQGIPGRALRVELDPDVPYHTLRNPDQEADAIQAAKRGGGRISLVRAANSGADAAQAKKVVSSYRAVLQRRWDGLRPLTVTIYDPVR